MNVVMRVPKWRIAATGAVAALMASSVGGGVAAAQPTTPPTSSSTTTAQAEASDCPVLQLVLINGTTESAVGMSPDEDSGFLSQVAVPAVMEANEQAGTSSGQPVVGRIYVPYSASFGGKPGDSSTDPYAKSVQMGIDNARQILEGISQQCPDTKVFMSGYSQGGQAASAIVRDIGHGKGPIPGDKLAGAALYSDPTREAGSPVFPGSTSQTSPQPAPGSTGEAISQVRLGQAGVPAGGGIAPNTADRGFGSVAGRVASFCSAGDLACDTPADAPIAKMVANIAGQSTLDPDDPIAALTSVSAAVGQSVLYTGASVVNDNIDFNSRAGQFEVKQSSETVLNRMVRYSDPANQADGISEAVTALTKVAGMAIGAAVTVAKDVLSPQSIAQIAAAGVAGPQAAALAFGARLLDATVQLVPSATVDKAAKLAFREIEQGVVDNKGLVRMAFDTQYWETVAKHGSYNAVPVGVAGQTPVELTKDWVVALAHDLTSRSGGAGKLPGTSSADWSGPLLAAAGQSVLSATQILDSSAVSSQPTSRSSAQPTATPSAAPTTTPQPAAQPTS